MSLDSALFTLHFLPRQSSPSIVDLSTSIPYASSKAPTPTYTLSRALRSPRYKTSLLDGLTYTDLGSVSAPTAGDKHKSLQLFNPDLDNEIKKGGPMLRTEWQFFWQQERLAITKELALSVGGSRAGYDIEIVRKPDPPIKVAIYRPETKKTPAFLQIFDYNIDRCEAITDRRGLEHSIILAIASCLDAEYDDKHRNVEDNMFLCPTSGTQTDAVTGAAETLEPNELIITPLIEPSHAVEHCLNLLKLAKEEADHNELRGPTQSQNLDLIVIKATGQDMARIAIGIAERVKVGFYRLPVDRKGTLWDGTVPTELFQYVRTNTADCHVEESIPSAKQEPSGARPRIKLGGGHPSDAEAPPPVPTHPHSTPKPTKEILGITIFLSKTPLEEFEFERREQARRYEEKQSLRLAERLQKEHVRRNDIVTGSQELTLPPRPQSSSREMSPHPAVDDPEVKAITPQAGSNYGGSSPTAPQHRTTELVSESSFDNAAPLGQEAKQESSEFQTLDQSGQRRGAYGEKLVDVGQETPDRAIVGCAQGTPQAQCNTAMVHNSNRLDPDFAWMDTFPAGAASTASLRKQAVKSTPASSPVPMKTPDIITTRLPILVRPSSDSLKQYAPPHPRALDMSTLKPKSQSECAAADQPRTPLAESIKLSAHALLTAPMLGHQHTTNCPLDMRRPATIQWDAINFSTHPALRGRGTSESYRSLIRPGAHLESSTPFLFTLQTDVDVKVKSPTSPAKQPIFIAENLLNRSSLIAVSVLGPGSSGGGGIAHEHATVAGESVRRVIEEESDAEEEESQCEAECGSWYGSERSLSSRVTSPPSRGDSGDQNSELPAGTPERKSADTALNSQSPSNRHPGNPYPESALSSDQIQQHHQDVGQRCSAAKEWSVTPGSQPGIRNSILRSSVGPFPPPASQHVPSSKAKLLNDWTMVMRLDAIPAMTRLPPPLLASCSEAAPLTSLEPGAHGPAQIRSPESRRPISMPASSRNSIESEQKIVPGRRTQPSSPVVRTEGPLASPLKHGRSSRRTESKDGEMKRSRTRDKLPASAAAAKTKTKTERNSKSKTLHSWSSTPIRDLHESWEADFRGIGIGGGPAIGGRAERGERKLGRAK